MNSQAVSERLNVNIIFSLLNAGGHQFFLAKAPTSVNVTELGMTFHNVSSDSTNAAKVVKCDGCRTLTEDVSGSLQINDFQQCGWEKLHLPVNLQRVHAVSALKCILARVGKRVNCHIVFVPCSGREEAQKKKEQRKQ